MDVLQILSDFLTERVSSLSGSILPCAVSCGPDSMVLVWGLHRLQDRFDYDLVPIHYNHRLQERSHQAEQTLTRWCHEKDLPLISAVERQPERLREAPEGLEASARSRRYRFFSQCVNLLDARGLFLGHHRGDQVESVLLNLGRGSGLYGLEAMGEVSEGKYGLTLFRPFLNVASRDLKETSEQLELPVVEDPSNRNMSHARNRIRHRLLPEWERAQPDPRSSIFRLSRRACKENRFWDTYLEEHFTFWEWDQELQLEIAGFRQQHAAAQDRFLHSVPRRLHRGSPGWSQRNVLDLKNLILEGESGDQLHLPSGTRAIREYGRVALYRGETPERFDVELDWDGNIHRRNFAGRWVFVDEEDESEATGLTYLSGLHFTSPMDGLRVRNWEAGDVILMNGRDRPIKELFQSVRLPYRGRRMWPILVDGDEVLSVAGLAVSDRVQAGTIYRAFAFHPEHPCFDQFRTGSAEHEDG